MGLPRDRLLNSYKLREIERKVMHRVWAYLQARLACTMAVFNVLVQWHGLQPTTSGFLPLSMAEFSL
jgi:FtsH-binding integral membrane protein